MRVLFPSPLLLLRLLSIARLSIAERIERKRYIHAVFFIFRLSTCCLYIITRSLVAFFHVNLFQSRTSSHCCWNHSWHRYKLLINRVISELTSRVGIIYTPGFLMSYYLWYYSSYYFNLIHKYLHRSVIVLIFDSIDAIAITNVLILMSPLLQTCSRNVEISLRWGQCEI